MEETNLISVHNGKHIEKTYRKKGVEKSSSF